MSEQLQKILADLERTGFFGAVEVGYQNGKPGHVKITKTLKLNSDYSSRLNRGHENEPSNSS